jgi:hypothetical protein
MSRILRRRLAWTILLSSACCSRTASAQDPGAIAAADALFRQGRQLFDEKRYDEACPKLAESFRIDPATGSLLALAACHEAQGKSASAWSEYNEVVSRARREGRTDRADAAQQRSTALEPRLSRLTVALGAGASGVPGLVVKRDGFVLGAGAFGAALPVDPGEHVVEASAPSRQPWSARTSVAADGASGVVTVPALSEVPTWAATEGDSRRSSGPPLRPIGIGVGAAGIVALGISGYFALHAASKNSDSQSDCTGDVCGPVGKQARLDAISSANASTAAFVIGAVLVAGGVALFIVGKPGESKSTLAAAPAISGQTAGVVLAGSF